MLDLFDETEEIEKGGEFISPDKEQDEDDSSDLRRNSITVDLKDHQEELEMSESSKRQNMMKVTGRHLSVFKQNEEYVEDRKNCIASFTIEIIIESLYLWIQMSRRLAIQQLELCMIQVIDNNFSCTNRCFGLII